MHEMLSSYEYGLQREIAPFHLQYVKNCVPMMTICAVRV